MILGAGNWRAPQTWPLLQLSVASLLTGKRMRTVMPRKLLVSRSTTSLSNMWLKADTTLTCSSCKSTYCDVGRNVFAWICLLFNTGVELPLSGTYLSVHLQCAAGLLCVWPVLPSEFPLLVSSNLVLPNWANACSQKHFCCMLCSELFLPWRGLPLMCPSSWHWNCQAWDIVILFSIGLADVAVSVHWRGYCEQAWLLICLEYALW